MTVLRQLWNFVSNVGKRAPALSREQGPNIDERAVGGEVPQSLASPRRTEPCLPAGLSPLGKTESEESARSVASAALLANGLDPLQEILEIRTHPIAEGRSAFDIRLRFWNGYGLTFSSNGTNQANAAEMSRQVALLLSDPEVRRVLKGIGFWCQEPGSGIREVFPDPTRMPPNAWSAEFREKVITYLNSGIDLGAFCGYSWCRFRCGASPQEMGASQYTDGTYLWPEGLVHYVRHHDIPLPEFFLETAAANGWRPSKGGPPRSFGTYTDNRTWIEWADQIETGA